MAESIGKLSVQLTADASPLRAAMANAAASVDALEAAMETADSSSRAFWAVQPELASRSAAAINSFAAQMEAAHQKTVALNKMTGHSGNQMRLFAGRTAKAQVAVQNMIYGIEDATVQFGTQGLAGAVRGASNNLMVLAAMLGNVKVQIATLGAIVAAQFLIKWWEMRDGIQAATKELEDFARVAKSIRGFQAHALGMRQAGAGGMDIGSVKEADAALKRLGERRLEIMMIDKKAAEAERANIELAIQLREKEIGEVQKFLARWNVGQMTKQEMTQEVLTPTAFFFKGIAEGERLKKLQKDQEMLSARLQEVGEDKVGQGREDLELQKEIEAVMRRRVELAEQEAAAQAKRESAAMTDLMRRAIADPMERRIADVLEHLRSGIADIEGTFQPGEAQQRAIAVAGDIARNEMTDLFMQADEQAKALADRVRNETGPALTEGSTGAVSAINRAILKATGDAAAQKEVDKQIELNTKKAGEALQRIDRQLKAGSVGLVGVSI